MPSNYNHIQKEYLPLNSHHTLEALSSPLHHSMWLHSGLRQTLWIFCQVIAQSLESSECFVITSQIWEWTVASGDISFCKFFIHRFTGAIIASISMSQMNMVAISFTDSACPIQWVANHLQDRIIYPALSGNWWSISWVVMFLLFSISQPTQSPLILIQTLKLFTSNKVDLDTSYQNSISNRYDYSVCFTCECYKQREKLSLRNILCFLLR